MSNGRYSKWYAVGERGWEKWVANGVLVCVGGGVKYMCIASSAIHLNRQGILSSIIPLYGSSP